MPCNQRSSEGSSKPRHPASAQLIQQHIKTQSANPSCPTPRNTHPDTADSLISTFLGGNIYPSDKLHPPNARRHYQTAKMPGFDFTNYNRNAALHARGIPLPKATSTGTTIVGCIFDGGVVVR